MDRLGKGGRVGKYLAGGNASGAVLDQIMLAPDMSGLGHACGPKGGRRHAIGIVELGALRRVRCIRQIGLLPRLLTKQQRLVGVIEPANFHAVWIVGRPTAKLARP